MSSSRLSTRVLPCLSMCCAVAVLSLFTQLSPAEAMTPQEEAAQTIEKIQREQQERQQRQLLEDAAKRHETAPVQPPVVTMPAIAEGAVCRDVSEIVLTGVTLLPKSKAEELTSPYRGKCLSVGDIEKLLSEILKAYIDRGYITVRPYVKAQDLSRGVLEILIVEGSVEKIRLEDGGKGSINLTTAFPFVEGKTLNLRDIEQGLDQVNRLASNGATMQIVPGTEAGDSAITIINNPTSPLGGSISMDNQGSDSTGKAQLGATINLDHPLGLNDFVTYTHRESIFENRDNKLTKMDSVFYSAPFGYALFSFSYNHSEYVTAIETTGAEMHATGTNGSYNGRLDLVVYRDQSQKLTTSTAFTFKSAKNYLDGNYLEVSSRDLSIFDFDLNWNGRLVGSIINLGAGYSKGLAVLDALEDRFDTPDYAPHAQGSKIRYCAGVMYPFTVASLYSSFSSQVVGQYAIKPLYGSEYISIGSYSSVRGFNKSSHSGDRGYYIRNEGTVTIPDVLIKGTSLKPFVGLDAGRIEKFNSTEAATLMGCAAGIRYGGKSFNGELALSHPLLVPANLERESTLFHASLALTF